MSTIGFQRALPTRDIQTQTVEPQTFEPLTVEPQIFPATCRTGCRLQDIMDDLLHDIAVKRDAAAFGRLFTAYAPKIKGYMMRRGADAATAEELAQETLMTVWRKAALYSSANGNLTGWIFTIARNLRIDRLRKEFAWQELSDEVLQVASTDIPADEQLASNEIAGHVRAALAELPDNQREIIILAYVDGFSQSEIAERLKLPLGTVKSRMRLAYQKVRLALEDVK
jgi:RNA polymerase sigma-70 factor, ECF subfamily